MKCQVLLPKLRVKQGCSYLQFTQENDVFFIEASFGAFLWMLALKLVVNTHCFSTNIVLNHLKCIVPGAHKN